MLRTFIGWFFLSLTASTATAEVATISNCAFPDQSILQSSVYYCDVDNNSETTIETIRYNAVTYKKGPTGPWVVVGSTGISPTVFQGGLMTGKHTDVGFWGVRVPNLAIDETLKVEVQDAVFLDANGDPITK